MCVRKFLTGVKLISLLTLTLSEEQLSKSTHNCNTDLSSVPLLKTPYELGASIQPSTLLDVTSNTEVVKNRNRRDNSLEYDDNNVVNNNEEESSFQKDETGWSNINSQVDMVIPMVLAHLQKLDIDYLQLPDMKETLTLNPLFITYEAGLYLTNGIVYNIAGVQRHGDSFMNYENKSFICRFNLLIKTLQFEYNFLIKLMALEGYGKVIGSLDDAVIYAELAISVVNLKLKLLDFRIVRFNNIHVQLDQRRIIGQLTGAILSPITNLFRDRITTSISDGLKDQMQAVMDDFNGDDPLQLQDFTKQLLSGLLGQSIKNSTIKQ